MKKLSLNLARRPAVTGRGAPSRPPSDLALKAPRDQLRARAAKRAEELQARGAPRVLVVYDDPEHARVYPEQRPAR